MARTVILSASMYVVSIPEVEAELRALGVPDAEFLKRAGIAERTWRRLKAGEYAPRQDTARRINAAMTFLRVKYGGNPSGGGGEGTGDKSLHPVDVVP